MPRLLNQTLLHHPPHRNPRCGDFFILKTVSSSFSTSLCILLHSHHRARLVPAAGENRRLTGAAYELQYGRRLHPQLICLSSLPRIPGHHTPAAPACRIPCPDIPGAGDILFSWVLLMSLRRVVGDILVLTLHNGRNFSPSLFKNSIIFISLPITTMWFNIRGYNLIVPSMYLF